MAKKGSSSKGKASNEADNTQIQIIRNFYLSIVERTKDAIVLLDGLKIIDVNKGTLNLFKVKKSEIIGKSPINFSPKYQNVNEPSTKKAMAIIKELQKENSVSYEWRFIKKDKTPFYTSVTLTSLPALGDKYAMALIRDIDYLKKAEKQLLENEERYRTIVENSAEIICRLTPEWKFSYINETFKTLLGYELGAIKEKAIWDLIFSEKREEFISKFKELNPFEEASYYYEVPIISKDAQLFYFGLTIKFIFKKGYLFRIQISGLNISERKKLETIREVFFNISHTLLKKITLDELYKEIHQNVAKLIPAKNFYIALYDEETETISFPYFIDEFDEPPKPRKLRRGLTEYILRTGKPFLATKDSYMDLAHKGEIELIGELPVDWLGIPLKTQGKTIGVIAVQSYYKEIRYDEQSKEILSYISQQIALAIEKKKSEEELSSSLSLLSSTLESTEDGILVSDLNGKIKLFNKRYADLWKLPEDLLNQKNHGAILEFVHEQLKDPVQYLNRTNMLYDFPEERAWDEIEFIDGRIFERFTQPQYLAEKIIGRVWSYRDITEKEKALRKVEYEKNLLHTLMDNIPDSIYFKDKDCKFIRINRGQAKMLGILREEDSIGKTDFDFFKKEIAIEMFNDETRIMETGKPIINKIEKIEKEDGDIIWVSATKVPTYDEFGNVTGIVGVSRDITQIKEAEEKLRKYSEDLKELNATKDKFLSIIAHDLKSPFSTLLGFLDLLRSEAPSLPPEELNQFIGHAYNSGMKVFKLLENLLEWAYLQKGKVVVTPEEFDLRTHGDESVEILLDKAKEKGIEIINSIPEGIKVFADKNMIQTVIRNLTNNSIKFTEPGGKIEMNAEANDDFVTVTIADTGVGMSPETKAELFRLDAHHTSVGTAGESGTGLGLIICKDMVEKNGGEIRVESELGKGTTFYFTLPRI